MFGTTIVLAFTGGDPFEKGSPPDPHPKTSNNFGQGKIVYNCAVFLFPLVVRYHRDAPPIGFASRRDAKPWGPAPHTAARFVRGCLNYLMFIHLIA